MNEKETTQERNKSVFSSIFSLFIPIAAGFLLQQAYSIADALVLGRMVGTRALAAVSGSNTTVINLVITLFAGLSSGAMVMTASSYGGGEKEKVRKTIYNSMILSLISGLFFFLLILFFSPLIHDILKTPDELKADSVRYLRWYFTGMVPMLIFNMGSNILRSLGITGKPLLYLALSSLSNVALDVLFVLIMKDAVFGVALASSISQAVSAILILKALMGLDCDTALRRGDKIDISNIKESLRIGIPSAVQNSMYFATSLLISERINSLGTVSVASWAVFFKYDGLYWALSSSFNLALLALSGQYKGAGRKKELKECASRGVLGYLIVAVPFSLLLFLFRFNAASLFSSDPLVVEESVRIIGYIALFYPSFTFTEVFSAVIRGTGNTTRPAAITFISIFIFRIILIFGTQSSQDYTISLCFVLPWILSSVLFFIYYISGLWMKKEV